MSGFVYLMASGRHGTLYIGVTNDITRRVFEHKDGTIKGFTCRYGCKLLVYYEAFDDIRNAIAREKAIKAWKRDWKIKLIEVENPFWDDLSRHFTA